MQEQRPGAKTSIIPFAGTPKPKHIRNMIKGKVRDRDDPMRDMRCTPWTCLNPKQTQIPTYQKHNTVMQHDFLVCSRAIQMVPNQPDFILLEPPKSINPICGKSNAQSQPLSTMNDVSATRDDPFRDVRCAPINPSKSQTNTNPYVQKPYSSKK